MADSVRLKIILIGPCKSGKTVISNYLADINQNLHAEYHPTIAVRIHEFERETSTGKRNWQGGNIRIAVELWDCSGDRKYEGCWSGILQDVAGVIIVFNPENRTADRELENWYSRFIQGTVSEKNCLIFAHNSSGESSGAKFKAKLSKGLAKVPMIHTSLDYDAETVKYEFDNLISSIAKESLEKRETEELSIMNDKE